MTAQYQNWNPPEDELLLLGPSAGYLIENQNLARFKKVVVVDKDPVALRLFRWNHKHPNIVLQNLDLAQGWPERQASFQLERLVQSHPEAAVAFGNCLGQLRLENPQWSQEFFDSYQQALEGRSVLSIHDRLSWNWSSGSRGSAKSFSNAGKTFCWESKNRLDTDELAKKITAKLEGIRNDSPIPHFLDHEVPLVLATSRSAEDEMSPNPQRDLAFSYCAWALTRRQAHLLECWRWVRDT